ncbi:hypothetical protein HMPREF1861_00986 [Corynebacterium kroppenstedtii]|nr:hypothetical protein HMPREF1861_00986 [Corynebacterium kroppenstedtii]
MPYGADARLSFPCTHTLSRAAFSFLVDVHRFTASIMWTTRQILKTCPLHDLV